MAKTKTDDPLLTTHQVADLLGAEPSSVIRWFDKGILKGWRTPGGHRRIRASSVVAYLQQKGMEIPSALAGVPPPGGSSSSSRRGHRLLWVDRDASFLLGVGRALAPFDEELETLLLDDPIEALLELERFDPQVVVFDLAVSDVNGLSAARALARRNKGPSRDLILVADELDPSLRRQAEEAGAVVVSRPAELGDVLRRLGLEPSGGPRALPEMQPSP